MQKWYQNKYVTATAVACVTGLIAAALVYVGTMTDGLDLRHTVKMVGLAFLGPFSVLVSVLPKITDILTPTVKIAVAGGASVRRLAGEQANVETVTTSDPVTTVVVDPLPRLDERPDADGVAVVQAEADEGAVT